MFLQNKNCLGVGYFCRIQFFSGSDLWILFWPEFSDLKSLEKFNPSNIFFIIYRENQIGSGRIQINFFSRIWIRFFLVGRIQIGSTRIRNSALLFLHGPLSAKNIVCPRSSYPFSLTQYANSRCFILKCLNFAKYVKQQEQLVRRLRKWTNFGDPWD